jgi:hypothetical protein
LKNKTLILKLRSGGVGLQYLNGSPV